MTEPQERPVDEHGHELLPGPTMPGVVLVNVTHPDDPPPTCTVEEAKASQRARWRCGRDGCPGRGTAPTPWLALAAVLEHESVCPKDPTIAASRQRARDAARPRGKP